jgi:hypothetical protein
MIKNVKAAANETKQIILSFLKRKLRGKVSQEEEDCNAHTP